MKLYFTILFFSIATLLSAQTKIGGLTLSEVEELKTMYKENYELWITSIELNKLQKESPAIDSIINSINITETLIYQKIKKKLAAEKKLGTPSAKNFSTIFNEKYFDYTVDYILDLLDPKNTEVITDMYWSIIKNNKSKQVGYLVVDHMQKAIDDIEQSINAMDHPKRH